jgi:hypothetical protein
MAEDEKGSDAGFEWYLWVFGGVLAIALLGNLASDSWNFAGGEDVPDQTQLTEGVNINQTEVDPSMVSSTSTWIEDVTTSVQNWLASFSIFELAPWYVWFAAVISFICLLIIIYSNLRYYWIMRAWDEEIGYYKIDDESDADVSTRSVMGDVGKLVEKSADAATVENIKISEPLQANYRDEELKENQKESDLNNEYQSRNNRWKQIEDLIDSNDQNDWRHAILEADIMLDELLQSLNYEGRTVAEKLQQISTANAGWLGDAWEAHKIRNRVAHEGSSFELTREIFMKTMAQFERVFKQNYVI